MKTTDPYFGIDPELAELLRVMKGAHAISAAMADLPNASDHMFRALQDTHRKRCALTDSINQRLLRQARP